MRPQTIGRVFGISLRLGGRYLGQVISGERANPAATLGGQARAAGDKVRAVGRGTARGVGGFLAPFRRVGGIVWLEVSGVFFLLPVMVFGPTLWRLRADALQGPNHRTFVLTAIVVALFLYLGVSSFWRAHRR